MLSCIGRDRQSGDWLDEMGVPLIHDSKNRGTRPLSNKRVSGGSVSRSIRELAEAGASGVALTSFQMREICEALRSQHRSVRNQFHSST